MATKMQNQEVIGTEVSNLEAAAMQPEQASEVTPQPEMSAVDQAAKELEELKAKMAEAKAKLAAAKKATTKSRPVRLSTFVVRVCLDRTHAEIGSGEQLYKSDVHYCAEKAAIDILAEDLKAGQTNEYVYAVCKRAKSSEAETVVELLWIDPETSQIVIE